MRNHPTIRAATSTRSGAYEQKAEAPVEVAKATNADGKRLPGPDYKFYEGGTRQHGFPQYESATRTVPSARPKLNKT